MSERARARGASTSRSANEGWVDVDRSMDASAGRAVDVRPRARELGDGRRVGDAFHFGGDAFYASKPYFASVCPSGAKRMDFFVNETPPRVSFARDGVVAEDGDVVLISWEAVAE